MYHVLATASDGGLWAADVVQYRIERWDRNGRLLLSLDGQRSWFEPQGRLPFVSRTQPPPPNIVSIVEDAGGLVWLLTAVPDARWREALGEEVQGTRESYVSIADWARFTDSIIEVIDPTAGQVVASLRFDWPLSFID